MEVFTSVTTRKGIRRDQERYRCMAEEGIRVIGRMTSNMVKERKDFGLEMFIKAISNTTKERVKEPG